MSTTFHVPDMTCGHCVQAITQAIQSADPAATVQVDLGRTLVQISGGGASAAGLAEAIRTAGYTPQAVAEAVPPAATSRGGCGSGCGCGSRRAAVPQPAPMAGNCCS